MTLRDMLIRGILSEEEVFACYPDQSLDYEPDMRNLVETTGRGAPYLLKAASIPYEHPKTEYYRDFPDILASQNSEMVRITEDQPKKSNGKPESDNVVIGRDTLKKLLDTGLISQEELYACFPEKDFLTYVPTEMELYDTLGRYVGSTWMDDPLSEISEKEKVDFVQLLIAGGAILLMVL